MIRYGGSPSGYPVPAEEGQSMLLKRFSLTEILFLALLVLIIVAMLVTALVVGLRPPESSEPSEPYELQQMTPDSESQGESSLMRLPTYDPV